MIQFLDFIKSELNELESRDADTLFECIRDNLEEMGLTFDDRMDADLYAHIVSLLK